MWKDEDLSLCTTTCNDETDTPRFRKLLRSIPGFNQQMQLRNLNESPWSQPQRKPQTKWIKTTASLRCIVPRLRPAPPTPAPGFAAHVFILCPVACPMFMLSTPGEELGFSFGLWRILADLGRSGIDNYKGTRSQLLPLILDLFAAVHRTTRCSCANLVAKSGF